MIKLVIFTVLIYGNTIKHKCNYQEDAENTTRLEPELCCIVEREHSWTLQNYYYHYIYIVVMYLYSWIQYTGCSKKIQEIRNSVLAKIVPKCRESHSMQKSCGCHLVSDFSSEMYFSHLLSKMQKRGQIEQWRLWPQHRACTFCIELCSCYT